MLLPVVFNGALILAVLLLVRYLLQRIGRAHNEAWRAYAAERGFSFTPSRGFWTSWRSARIEGAHAGVPVVLDCYFIRVGRGTALRTRASAGARSPGEAALAAFPRSDARIEAHEGGAALSWPGFEVDPTVLDAACAIVAAGG